MLTDAVFLGMQWPSLIFVGIFFILGLFCAVKLLLRRLKPVKTVNARVVDKSRAKLDINKGTGPKYRYTVVFQTEEHKIGFQVSELTYDGYHMGETGMLTYKGDRLIDFH